MENLYSVFTIEDLPNDDLKTVADMYGLELAIKIMEDMAGTVINVPKTGMNKFRNRYICKNYDGSKICRMRLARKFGVTERYIIKLVSRHRKGAS